MTAKAGPDKLLLKSIRRERVERRPLWIMRQAGRYLPEYREFRARHSFKDLAGDAELATEVTLMPIRRFPLDAAIVAISPQSVESHREFSEAHGGFGFPLLSDPDKSVGAAYGILGLMDLYRRSTFVVDPEGKIEYAAYNVKATGHVAKLRKDLGLETA